MKCAISLFYTYLLVIRGQFAHHVSRLIACYKPRMVPLADRCKQLKRAKPAKSGSRATRFRLSLCHKEDIQRCRDKIQRLRTKKPKVKAVPRPDKKCN